MKKLKVLIAAAPFALTLALTNPTAVLAQAGWMPDGPKQGSLDDLIRDILNTAIILAAIVAVIFLIYNGFKYMSSAGDANKTEEAQKGIANALIGLIICIAAALIVNFVLGRLGLDPESLE